MTLRTIARMCLDRRQKRRAERRTGVEAVNKLALPRIGTRRDGGVLHAGHGHSPGLEGKAPPGNGPLPPGGDGAGPPRRPGPARPTSPTAWANAAAAEHDRLWPSRAQPRGRTPGEGRRVSGKGQKACRTQAKAAISRLLYGISGRLYRGIPGGKADPAAKARPPPFLRPRAALYERPAALTQPPADAGRVIRRYALHPHPVLVQGRTGTGKELVAHALHTSGAHPDGPFVSVNCAAIPKELRPKLFGYAPRGLFRRAQGRQDGAASSWPTAARSSSTSIGDTPLYSQVKLLRILEEK